MKKCPICKQELDKRDFDLYSSIVLCKNKCFHFVTSSHSYQYKIFNDKFIILYRDNLFSKLLTKFKINKKIRYWRKNDRYLTELLK